MATRVPLYHRVDWTAQTRCAECNTLHGRKRMHGTSRPTALDPAFDAVQPEKSPQEGFARFSAALRTESSC